jgi:hypothetical protein
MADVGRHEPGPRDMGHAYQTGSAPNALVDGDVETQQALALHEADRTLVEALLRFGRKRLGADWMNEVTAAYFDGYDECDYEVQLLLPWAVYDFDNNGFSLAHLYRAHRGHHLSAEEQAWLEAQDKAWLSVWDVQHVEVGKGVTVKDLLTKEERFVNEVQGSQALHPKDCVLARVVDFGAVSTFCGLHPRALPPGEVELVVRKTRQRCGVQTRAVPVAKLREADVQQALINLWHFTVTEADAPRHFLQPANTDGDPISVMTSHFDVERVSQPRPPEHSPELSAILREFKERYMARWLDEATIALGGLTPRAAAQKPQSRAKLDLVLQDMEMREAGLRADEQIDFAKVRCELGVFASDVQPRAALPNATRRDVATLPPVL